MHLEGSCHCASVRFSCEAYAPVPYLYCYCSICRKTAGGGGYAINLGAWKKTLTVQGRDHVGTYRARISGNGKDRISSSRRYFCKRCGSHLWAYTPEWPELVHPLASAIDTPLPEPPERVHIMLGSKANWTRVRHGKRDCHFNEYPDESLQAWHRRHGFG